jgi:hypothetical protein
MQGIGAAVWRRNGWRVNNCIAAVRRPGEKHVEKVEHRVARTELRRAERIGRQRIGVEAEFVRRGAVPIVSFPITAAAFPGVRRKTQAFDAPLHLLEGARLQWIVSVSHQRSSADRPGADAPKKDVGGGMVMIPRSSRTEARRPAVVEADEALRTFRLAAAACLRDAISGCS